MATELEWQNLVKAMEWSLGPESDKDARHELQDGLLAADLNRFQQVKNGFHETQRHKGGQGARDAFDSWAKVSQSKIYNMGRGILKLPPI